MKKCFNPVTIGKRFDEKAKIRARQAIRRLTGKLKFPIDAAKMFLASQKSHHQ
jgi:hypothetical protein